GPTALLLPRARSLAWPGTWRMMRRFWRSGMTEIAHALSRSRVAAAARRLVPEIEAADLARGWSGTRAQALARDGRLLDDFALSEAGPSLHVRNAPSPAATSAL